MKTLSKLTSEPIDRRQLLQTGGLAGLGLLGAGLLAGCGGSDSTFGDNNPTPAPGSDADVLNFALNLEYLEAEYYLRATTGMGLSAADSGSNPGTVIGGKKVNFVTPSYMQFANEIAQDELAHVRFLRSALGSAAVSRPEIDFTNAFNAAAKAAGIANTFDPFANEVNFLVGAFVFEDVGVTAYHGGATLINSKSNLSAAAGILGTEAYHAGLIRTLLYDLGATTQSYTQKISALRASVGGGKDQPVVLNGHSNIVPADSNAITFARTTREVLNIVYLSVDTHMGGFFPKGLNGNIK